MPYSRSLNAISRVEGILDQMVKGESDLEFKHPEPNKLAYWIHNAIAVARRAPDHERYAQLDRKYKIRIRVGKVTCEYRDKSVQAVLKEQMSKITFADVDNVVGIVGAMVAHKPQEGFFPDAFLSADELVTLHKWTQATGYFIVNHEDAGITVTKNDPGVVKWEP